MLVGAAWAAEPFVWRVSVDGAPREVVGEGPVDAGLTGWSCGFRIEAPRDDDGAVEQFGVLVCEGDRGDAVDTAVMCRTHPGRPTDRGSGVLLVGQAREVALELTCATPGAPEPPRLQLEPGTTPGASAGLPAHREPPVPGRFRWQLSWGDQAVELTAPGPIPAGPRRWACEQQVSGVTDPAWGDAQYATLSCTTGGTRFTMMLPCAKRADEPHACHAGSLRVAPRRGAAIGMLLVCEDQGNPGCF